MINFLNLKITIVFKLKAVFVIVYRSLDLLMILISTVYLDAPIKIGRNFII